MKIWQTRRDVEKTLKTLNYYYEKLNTSNLQLLLSIKKLLNSTTEGMRQYFWEKLPEYVYSEEKSKEIVSILNNNLGIVIEDAKIIDKETGDYTAYLVFIWDNNILFLTPWKPTEHELDEMISKYKDYFKDKDIINVFFVPTIDMEYRTYALTDSLCQQ